MWWIIKQKKKENINIPIFYDWHLINLMAPTYQSSNSQTYFFNIWGKNLSNKGKQLKISTQWIKTEDNI